MVKHLSVIAPLTAIAACTTMPAPQDMQRSQSDTGGKLICDAETVQSFVGQTIKAETGEQILVRSGAASLRWGPPDSAWTMDYRADRVNVRYDRAMTITDITCG